MGVTCAYLLCCIFCYCEFCLNRYRVCGCLCILCVHICVVLLGRDLDIGRWSCYWRIVNLLGVEWMDTWQRSVHLVMVFIILGCGCTYGLGCRHVFVWFVDMFIGSCIRCTGHWLFGVSLLSDVKLGHRLVECGHATILVTVCITAGWLQARHPGWPIVGGTGPFSKYTYLVNPKTFGCTSQWQSTTWPVVGLSAHTFDAPASHTAGD